MDQTNMYSIRMHASAGEKHVSGAERIVTSDKIDMTVQDLVARARKKATAPDQIVVKVESLGNTSLRSLAALDVLSLPENDWNAGRTHASRVLQRRGIAKQAIEKAIHYLDKGPAPSGHSMRGAMIMDARSGERLEPDQERGVRVSRFDWSEDALKRIDHCLTVLGLKHVRTREALCLATKVAYGPGLLAELCWSDDPDYVAGYVASLDTGYMRFPALKRSGSPKGGRVFFIDRSKLDMASLIRYLETEAVMITDVGMCGSALDREVL